VNRYWHKLTQLQQKLSLYRGNKLISVSPYYTSYTYLAICGPSGCTLASGVVVVVVVVCNRSQMKTSKCRPTCLIFGVSIGFDPG